MLGYLIQSDALQNVIWQSFSEAFLKIGLVDNFMLSVVRLEYLLYMRNWRATFKIKFLV